MSTRSPLESVWNQGGDSKSTTTFLDHLADAGLLAHRPIGTSPEGLHIDDLRPRNQDRVRILKRLSTSPGGLSIKALVSETVKGQPIGQCKRIDGSDKDYNFVYNFVNDLTDHVPPGYDVPLLRKRNQGAVDLFVPRTSLIDLISEGITQTPTADGGNLYDREFARDVLRTSRSLSENQKEHLENALESYVDRIDDYCLLFDVISHDRGHEKRDTMTKRYKTRFNDEGRVAKNYAMFNDALEYHRGYARNAVCVTLTTDPGTTDDPTRPDPRSLMEMVESINPNFNRLNSWFDSDPSKAADTRIEGVPQWTPDRDPGNYQYFPDGEPKGGAPDGPVTGRPRKRLDYIKVLEFTEKGYPHLHILFFDVPTREKDGMPWLVDKRELEKRWKKYGQGQVVDVWPLVNRDLDDLDADFATDDDQGFVDWYRFGDHGRDDGWIQHQIDQHDYLDFSPDDDDDNPTHKTAGAYLGKYLSATFGSLLDTSESMSANPGTHEEKSATWKLALYWATQQRFFSMSAKTRFAITPNEHLRDDARLAAACRWITKDTIQKHARREVAEHYARNTSDLDLIEDAAENAADAAITPFVESTLPESVEFGVLINYRGAYRKWDLPTEQLSAPVLDDSTDHFGQAQNNLPNVTADRPPPIETVWHE